VEVANISQDHGRVDVTIKQLANSEAGTLSASFVVAADGAYSAIRSLSNIHLQSQPEPESFVLADVTCDLDIDRQSSHVFLQEQALFLALPVPEGWRFVLREHVLLRQTDEDDMALSLLQAACQQAFAHDLQRQQVAWLSRFTLQRAVAEQFRNNRVFLAGDAAHVFSPVGAQGLNAGLADISNLSWKLAQFLRGKASADLLDSYQQERWEVAEEQSARVDTWSKISNVRGRLLTAARDATLKVINTKPSMGRRILRRMAQMDVHYRGSPAVFSDEAIRNTVKGLPQSGDFLPTLALRFQGSDEPISTLQLLSSGKHHLFLYVGDGVGPAETVAVFALIERVPVEFKDDVKVIMVHNEQVPEALIDAHEFEADLAADVDSQWQQRLGHHGLFLLRPDGHLAFSGELSQAIKLIDWMQDYFLYEPNQVK
jgi:pentachlorophenol monooxygenase